MQNPSCIDLLLTNNSCAFQQTTTVCSGLSDCHKLVLTVLKTSIPKGNPREITYRDYKKFDSLKFNNELKNVLAIENIDNCTMFDEKFLEVLDKHAPLKKKLLRANHASYVSKALRKAIMRRSYLEKVYFKNRTENSLRAFKKQKNFCSRLYKKERKKFFNSLNPSFVKDNKLFWKTVKPFFSNKGDRGSNIQLVKDNELLQDDQKIADELNTFFKNAVSNLNINENTYIINYNSGNLSDPVDKAICKYKFHPSILLIKSKLENQKLFLFQLISKFDMEKEIQNIDLKKATTKNTIPPKISKIRCNTSAETLQNLFNECLII